MGNPRPEPDAEGNYELDLDITLFKNGTAVTPDGTEYYVRIDIGKNLNVTSFTHNGEALAEDKWGYNATEGILWFYTTGFSPFKTTYYQTNTVTFDANGGTGNMTAKTIKRGAEATLPENEFTNEDLVFAGWNTDKEGDGAAYADGSKFTAYTDMTLYAQWKAADQQAPVTYTVTFVSGIEGVDNTTQSFAEGTAQNLAQNTFTKAGYNFSGWNTKADGTGTAYTNNASFTATADTTLYAQWTAIPTESVSLNKTSTTLTVGGSETLTATITPAPLGNAAWTSDNDTVAVVNAQGKITAVAKGTANITAAYGDKSATCRVTVNEPPEADMRDMLKEGSTIRMTVLFSNSLELDGLPIEFTFKKTATGFETISFKTYADRMKMNLISEPKLNIDPYQDERRFCYLTFGGNLADTYSLNGSPLINFYDSFSPLFTYSNYWNAENQTKIMLTGLSINGTEMSLTDFFGTGTSRENLYRGLVPNDPELINNILEAYRS